MQRRMTEKDDIYVETLVTVHIIRDLPPGSSLSLM